MPNRPVLVAAAALLALSLNAAPAQTTASNQLAPDGKPHSFRAGDGQFLLDGKPFRVISGEMHYPRIPREYWRARLKMARAMGLNAITTYVFWNVHEPKPGVYDFSGQNDVAEFVREAQQEGLYVILRPGPYVCAEWEFGGYPSWLLKDPATVVRSQDPKFLEPATRWLKRLGQELAPLQIDRGGPIVLVQVENEYGSFGNDHVYMDLNRKALLDAGFAGAQLYTADGPGDVANGSLPDLPVGINFDGNKPNQAQKSFATLKAARPDGPMFNSEFWAGWFDHWGSAHAHTSTETQAANLAWMLAQGYSVSIYMFHGGTDFGWMNGANSSDSKKEYQPDVTSYDYDAALDESGRPTPKFFAFRKVIAQYSGCPINDGSSSEVASSRTLTPSCLPPIPEVAPPIALPPIRFTESASLWTNLPKPIESPTPLTMEDIGQSYGYILYRTRLPIGEYDTGTLTIHDYACVYLNHVPANVVMPDAIGPSLLHDYPCDAIDRRLGQDTVQQTGGRAARNHLQSGSGAGPDESWVDVLVENSGRINYSHQLRYDRKGVVAYTPPVDPAPGFRWYSYPLPMMNPSANHFRNSLCAGPCFYRAHFDLPAHTTPADTFLDTSFLGKGQLWVNGHALGRFWTIGPQKTLYLPGPWLKPAANEIVIFDLDGKGSPTVQSQTQPRLGQTALETPTGDP